MSKNITLIIMSAGESSRFRQVSTKFLDSTKEQNLNIQNQKNRIKKHWIRINGVPIWLYVANRLQEKYNFKKVLITAHKDEVSYMRRFCEYEIIEGGNSRQETLQNALKIVNSEFICVSDAARFNLDFDVLDRLFSFDLNSLDCLAPVLNVVDTIFLQEDSKLNYLNRDNVKLVQTPQISRLNVLKKALKLGNFSDESSAINAYGGRIATITGSKNLEKLTYFSDLKNFALNGISFDKTSDSFTGFGFDVHKFVKNKEMTLGGIKIDCDFGFEAHSDGDVLIHSLCDAFLGSIGAGDIGEWFPPSSDEFKDIDSKILLKKVIDFVYGIGFRIVNIDIMILAEIPKINPYKDEMIKCIAQILQIEKNKINIKATTMEKMGFIGRGEGVCVSSNVSLKYSLEF